MFVVADVGTKGGNIATDTQLGTTFFLNSGSCESVFLNVKN